jgi:putative oxidoreductase
MMVGYGFMQHGFAKLSRGSEAFAIVLHAIGVPAPHLMAWLTILMEVFGGLAVLLGAFIPLVSLPMAGLLLVAIFSVHLPYGFSSIKLVSVISGRAQFGPPGYECDLLYLACLAALLVGGSGPLAIDGSRIWKRWRLSSVSIHSLPRAPMSEHSSRHPERGTSVSANEIARRESHTSLAYPSQK